MTRYLFLFIIPLLLIVASCSPDPREVDVSAVKAKPLEVMRLENDLFAMNEENFAGRTKLYLAKYGPFYEHYLMTFLNRGGTGDSLYRKSVLSFISDRDVREAYQYIKKEYPKSVIDEMMPGVNECVRRFKAYFPGKKLPSRLITCSTGWNYAFAYMDSAFVIGLDMYLGDTAKFYQMLRYPQYQVRKMNRHHILPDLARGWLLTEFDNTEAQNILLNHTVFYGKLFYAIESLLPHIDDSLVIGYTAKQMQYCRSYEKNLWGYFAEKNRLFENSLDNVRELTSDGPFTGAIHKDCPPRIAMWVGWQIVRSYMDHNREVTLEQLMNEKDAQKVLNKSRYRP
jgi:hypothetical protein